jgi:hypothetical protein
VQWARNEAAPDAPALELSLLVRAPVLHRVELSRCPTNQYLATIDSHSAAIVVRQFCVRKRRLKIRHYKASQFGGAQPITSRNRKMVAPHFLKKTILLDYF